MNFNQNP